jgi:hypothetical protein
MTPFNRQPAGDVSVWAQAGIGGGANGSRGSAHKAHGHSSHHQRPDLLLIGQLLGGIL